MLHSSKSQSILQWYNALTTEGTVQGISEFADGTLFQDIISSVHCLWKSKVIQSEGSVLNNEKAVTSSSSDSEKAAGFLTKGENESSDAVHFNDKTRRKKNISVEVQKRYEEIKSFVDEFFQVNSSSFINYPECANGKEMELAKVAVMLLSAVVQNFLSSGNQAVYTATMLDPEVQEDIKECLDFVLAGDCSVENSYKKSEFNKVLSRAAKCKGSQRRRASSQEVEESYETPKDSLKKKKGKLLALPSEEHLESPLKILLDSPQMMGRAAMYRKIEFQKLQKAFYEEEEKVNGLTLEKNTLNEELEKKKKRS